MPEIEKPKLPIKNPDAGKIKIVVSGSTEVKSSDRRVVIERR